MNEINIYQYWHGERPTAVLRLEKTVETLYSAERGYKYHRLTDADLPDEIRSLLNRCRIANIADLFRYWLICNNGGVWFDSDIAVRTIIDFHKIFSKSGIVATANCRKEKYHVSNGIIGAEKGNCLIKRIYEVALHAAKTRGKNMPFDKTGPKLAKEVLMNYKRRWIRLPEIGYKHQVNYRDNAVYREPTESHKNIVENNSWSYAHFWGGNLVWWKNHNMPTGCVIGDTVVRCEKELGYSYEY